MSTKWKTIPVIAFGALCFLIPAGHAKADTQISGTMVDGTHIDLSGNETAYPTTYSGSFCSSNAGNTAITSVQIFYGSYPDESSSGGGSSGAFNWSSFTNYSIGDGNTNTWLKITYSIQPTASCGFNTVDTLYVQLTCSAGSCTVNSPITPASTEFNEVIRYYPGLNYATSTGTTTIGAQFSIPSPDLIEGIGFELNGSTDTSASTTVAEVSTLYTATTTVSTAQTLSITTDYNFTNGGYYTINAFFIQNGKRVYNTTIATVLINYVPPNIVVGNDGQFHFNGTTTVATSTYEALHFDCGSTFVVADICKLAIAFVVPDPSAIQGVKDNFNAILLKAPFSFFTDSKKLLDAFQLGTASSGGTFSLTLYGANVPIISTTTAASIGLDSSVITTLKNLITIGLWVLLAWYLYWRIASIFGV